jgi:hypothetical protein
MRLRSQRSCEDVIVIIEEKVLGGKNDDLSCGKQWTRTKGINFEKNMGRR